MVEQDVANASLSLPVRDLKTKNVLELMIANPDLLDEQLEGGEPPASNYDSTKIPVSSDYVVVTSEYLAPAFSRFIDWKSRKGVSIELVTIEEIYSNYTGDEISGIYDNAGKLRQFLKEAYNDGNGITYALLGGVDYLVPIRYGHHSNNTSDVNFIIPTDLYFADFDGNWDSNGNGLYGEPADEVDFYPEIYVGRVLVRNQEEVSNWTDKIIAYENNPGMGDFSYLLRVFFTQADQMQDWFNEATLVANHIDWSSEVTIYEEEGGGNTPYLPSFPKGKDVIDEFNTRYGLASFMGHGGRTGVDVATKGFGVNTGPKYKVQSIDSYTSSNLVPEEGNGFDNFTNSEYPTIFYSISCTTTPFDVNPPDGEKNMGEVYTAISQGGGPAYLGNTRYGWVLSSTNLFIRFVESLNSGSSNKIGIVQAASKLQISSIGLNRYLHFSHNLVGCPETQFWTAIPQRKFLSIDYQAGIATIYDSDDNKYSGVDVVFDDGENRFVGTSDQDGQVSCPFPITPLTQISSTETNYLPSYTYILDDNEVWAEDVDLRGNIVIPEGKTLTIESTISLPRYGFVIVMGGGNLFLNNGGKLLVNEIGSGVEVLSNGLLRVGSNSELLVATCLPLTIHENASFIADDNSVLKIYPNAIINSYDGHYSIDIHPEALIPPGFIHPYDVVPPTYWISNGLQIWDNKSYQFHNELVIESGAELKLTNSEVSFFHNAGVTIKVGAHLEIQNSSLFDFEYCDNSTWAGVTVNGRIDRPQTFTNQGRLTTNGSLIRGAEVGVRIKGGGISTIDNSLFLNNIVSLSFEKYRWHGQNNESSVTNSTFTLSDSKTLGSTPIFINLDRVSKISILGNTFQNTDPDSYPLTQSGYGVKAFDADIELECSSPNLFSNLFTAIDTKGFIGVPYFKVAGQTFSNCFNGIVISSYPSPIVSSNSFVVPNISMDDIMPTAISIGNIRSFEVFGNTIIGLGVGYGLLLENRSRYVSGLISNNIFKNLTIGLKANGFITPEYISQNNNSINVVCNEFIENGISDMVVLNNGISSIQGNSLESAANRFASSSQNIFATGHILNYYAFGNGSYYPALTEGSVNVLKSLTIRDCEVKPFAESKNLVDIEEARLSLADAKIQHSGIQDLGSTSSLISLIDNFDGSDPLALRGSLLEKSPFLSDSVMVKVAEDAIPLPDLFLAHILMSNPHAPKSNEVVEKLESRCNPLPAYLMEALFESGQATSPIDFHKSQINYFSSKRDISAGNVLHRFLGEGDEFKQYDSLRIIKNYHPDLAFRYLAAFAAYEMGQISNCFGIFQNIQEDYDLSYSQEETLLDLLSLTNLFADFEQENGCFSEIDSEFLAAVASIEAKGNEISSLLATNLLTYIDTIPFLAPLFTVTKKTGSVGHSYEPYVAVKTYPIDRFLIVYYDLGNSIEDEHYLKIYNPDGELVYSNIILRKIFEEFIEVKNWKSGRYIVNIVGSGFVKAETSFYIYGKIEDNSSFKETDMVPKVQVYPNPTSDLLTIAVEGNKDLHFSYKVFSQSGNKIREGYGNLEEKISLMGLEKGIYLVKVNFATNSLSFPVILK